MSDRSRNGHTTPPEPVEVGEKKYLVTPQNPPKGCLWAGGIILGVPAFIVWVKMVAVLINWLMGG